MALVCALADIDAETKRALGDLVRIEPAAPAAGRRGGMHHHAPAPPPPFMFACLNDGELRVPLHAARARLGRGVAPADGWPALAPAARSAAASNIALRDAQTPVVDEAMRHIEEHGSTTIQVQPGAGKTVMATHIACRLGLVTLILVPRVPLVDQWRATISAACGDAAAVFVPEQAARARKKAAPETFDFAICLKERVGAMPAALLARVGTLVVDEAHVFCVPSAVAPLLATAPRHVLALTATLPRDDTAHRMVHLLAGAHDVFRAQTKPYALVPLRLGVRVRETASARTGSLDYSAFVQAVAACDAVNDAVVETVLRNPGRKFIVLSKLVAHAHALAAALCERGVDAETMCGSKRSCADADVLVGTTDKIGTGFDVATFCTDFGGRTPDALIMTHTVKKWQNYAQFVGRVLRARDGVVPAVVCVLTDNAVSRRHFDGVRKYAAANGGVVASATTGPPLLDGEPSPCSTSEPSPCRKTY